MQMYNSENKYCGEMTYANPSIYDDARDNGFNFSEPIEGVNADLTYWDGGAKEMPDSPCEFSSLETQIGNDVVISKIPKGAAIKIDGCDVEWIKGDIELSADVVGSYQIEIDCWPHRPLSKTIEVVA